MVAVDSMSDYLSDDSDPNKNVHPRTPDYNGTINQKNWLLQQYRSLGSKVVLQLDNKPIRKNGLYTLLGSTFRSVMMRIAKQGTVRAFRWIVNGIVDGLLNRLFGKSK